MHWKAGDYCNLRRISVEYNLFNTGQRVIIAISIKEVVITYNPKNKKTGFTIVELLIVVVVIAILASITIVAYGGVQKRAAVATMSSDLHNTANIISAVQIETGAYPTTLPNNVKPSPRVILQLASSGTSGAMCINAHHSSDPALRMSWDSAIGSIKSQLCSGIPSGDAVGGTVPQTARAVNLVVDFSQWTLTGGANYNTTTEELTLTPSGVAVSPKTRVDTPRYITVGGDFYATTAATSTALAPDGGYHTGINYYANDSTTLVLNSTNYTGNGCAQPFGLNTWAVNVTKCIYNGGPNVVYVRFTLTGSNANFASPDLKIKNPFITVKD